MLTFFKIRFPGHFIASNFGLYLQHCENYVVQTQIMLYFTEEYCYLFLFQEANNLIIHKLIKYQFNSSIFTQIAQSFSCESAKNLSTVCIHNMWFPPLAVSFPEACVHPIFLFPTVLLSSSCCCPKLCSLILLLESQTDSEVLAAAFVQFKSYRNQNFPVSCFPSAYFPIDFMYFYSLSSNFWVLFFLFFCPEFSVVIYGRISLIGACLSHIKSRFQKPEFLSLNFLNYPSVFQSSSFYCKIILNKVPIYFLNL